ncbi:hypothetical protein PPL_11258 [Heterostelium album PN500]|uniref:Autophagy-related protein 27 n=1 Tax=Heterostelium pallidum (strain ATCC 26659 / Pp 5 / PN500) TaxID=670386 RepID=D3BTZ8_HETP5|nr:hypothetical protein PPL_11258 [Heterostelium album PN500]EFA75184.1 hypothetical protein PPL_11258 [Heterostelium album PN500]|eukprot:XP_020427318.1 hypothetical protein PPL_11258 [Heterostelium album PN500]
MKFAIVGLVLVCLALLNTPSSASISSNCGYTSKNGTKYDFSELANNYTEYSFTITSGVSNLNMLFWSICQPAPTCVNQKLGDNVAACQNSKGTYFSLGLVSSMTVKDLASENQGGMLSYSNPKQCQSSTLPRVLELDMQCTPGAGYVIKGGAENPTTKCLYQVSFSSGYACPGTPHEGGTPKKGGLGGGWIFVIILVVSISVYILVGLAVNFKVRGLRGKEMFPNYTFWSDFPGLMKDGVLFIKGKVTGSGSSAGGYQQV